MKRPYLQSTNLKKLMFNSTRNNQKFKQNSYAGDTESSLPKIDAEKARILIRRQKSHYEAYSMTKRSHHLKNTSYCDESISIEDQKTKSKINIKLNGWQDGQRNEDSSSEFSDKSPYPRKRSLPAKDSKTANHLMVIDHQ